MAEHEAQAALARAAAQLGEHAREGAADPVCDVFVDLLGIEATDVVGLEDAWIEAHRFANASFSLRCVSSRLSGSTRSSPMTDMKLVSPSQRGTTWK